MNAPLNIDWFASFSSYKSLIGLFEFKVSECPFKQNKNMLKKHDNAIIYKFL